MEKTDRSSSAKGLNRIFSVIVIAQFCGTSLWFAGNAVVLSLARVDWPAGAAGHLTTAVQVGFITGTLWVTLTGLADRFSPSKLFFLSTIGGAISNLVLLVNMESFYLAVGSRFATGVFLGGIYPVGMKIAADWREYGLGDWLGALVGALVVGTALPHALRGIDGLQHPTHLLTAVSAIALSGGFLLYHFVPDGPYRVKSTRFSFRHLSSALRSRAFRSPLFGYFGHMWELYTFWAFVPWILQRYTEAHPNQQHSMPLLSFMIIAIGGPGCWLGGKMSLSAGSNTVARAALFISGICCLASPLFWNAGMLMFFAFLFVWGISVCADSPQFSALIAASAPSETRGTALTFATCIGFTITIVSIQTVLYLEKHISPDFLLWVLIPGPFFGLLMSRSRA